MGGESEVHVDECEKMSHTHSLALTLCTFLMSAGMKRSDRKEHRKEKQLVTLRLVI